MISKAYQQNHKQLNKMHKPRDPPSNCRTHNQYCQNQYCQSKTVPPQQALIRTCTDTRGRWQALMNGSGGDTKRVGDKKH